MKRLYVLCAVLLMVTAPTALGVASLQVLTVPSDFGTIQEALNAAEPGAIITVAPGTYCERVTIKTPDIRLRSAPALGQTGAILSGTACGGAAGVGFGIHVMGVSGVEISGFTIEGYESGIVLHNATQARIHLNEIRNNVYAGSASTFPFRAQGVVLIASSFNDITQNSIHDNGHLGIGFVNSSNSNLVRANRLTDNQAQQSTYANYACSIMLWGSTNSGNRIVENEVIGSLGSGIMVSTGVQAGNLVAQNRVHGHPGPGIIVMSGASGNVIQQNDARGNGTDNWTDLWDFNATTVNVWQRNLGTCSAGNAGCE